ncbi:hypothetical protein [Kitasatospora kifunensis]|uniref:Secreted protein n=1 Tax=Kitasatospora kifunensis TaxID=58351 RepID=A0A7W7RA30_KITKI|nr:hypothetical protein [Kitasatospora kifunensis]MBB4928188.1 hypothetical protein [Kitasatospora kifunensis]
MPVHPLPKPPRRRLGRSAALGALAATALTVLAGAAHATGTPQPRDADGNLSNHVTSTSPGANCVTSTEPGCSTLTVHAVPMIDPGMAALALVPAGLGTLVILRRRTTA